MRGAFPAEVTLVDLGEHRLRDLTEALGVFQVVHPELGQEFPPSAVVERVAREPAPSGHHVRRP